MDDEITDPIDQEKVKAAFLAATRSSGTEVIFKVYNKKTLSSDSNIDAGPGHNLHWAAHRSVAADVNEFIGRHVGSGQ